MNHPLKVIEEFISINGEGDELGRRTYFVRVAGCSAGCPGCDTQYALTDDKAYLLDGPVLMNNLRKNNLRHLTITGGEPLEQQNFLPFIDYIIRHAIEVTVESNGLKHPTRLPSPVHWVISPKPWMLTDKYRDSYFYWARLNATFKFAGGTKDVQRIRKWFKIFRLNKAYIQPWIEKKGDKTIEGYIQLYKELVKEVHLQFNASEDIRVTPQWHKLMFGFDAKGVDEKFDNPQPKTKGSSKN